MPQFIEGVINLRGTIIPVVDLRRRFAVKAAQDDPRKARMMITRGALREGAVRNKALLGLVVDGVSEVLHLSPDQIDRAPEAATGRNADFIAGMGKLGDRLIILIDLSKILSRQERDALAEAGSEENKKMGR
jgi:purine-binding chemotaxis protein CheW